MKKFISIVLVMCFSVCLGGCESDKSQSLSDSGVQNEMQSSVETVSYPRGTSETAIALYDEYMSFAKEENFELTELTLDDDFTEFYLNYDGTSNNVFFKSNKKSFDVSIDAEKDSKLEKEIIARLLMGLDNISESSALEFAEQLVTNEVAESLSEPISVGDYIVLLNRAIYTDLKFYHLDEIQKNDIDVSMYSEIDKKTFSNELNFAKKVKLCGKVTESGIFMGRPDLYYYYVVFTDNSGVEYLCEYCYNDIPVIFSEGDRYTIYGELTYSMDLSEGMKLCVSIEKFVKN